ncbi:MAG: two component, sigma54 specific, transcriptional regulator, Fis family [Dehalococcoidales bacterium]|nr:two component, sigma54 specific, transcriptional regulator, Fis family [Dehalococcoidales bacterium]
MEVKKRKILLVEDEAIVRESLRDWLIDDGYNVDVAKDGEEALKKIKEEEFRVIVLDLKLPGIDGLQLFEEAKELKPKTKGVIITAYPSKETREKAQRLGLLDYLPKPFKVEDLEKIISRALEELEKTKLGTEHLWLSLGAVSFRLCDRDYECGSCAFAQDIQDRFGTIAVIGEDKVAGFRGLPGSQRPCRYASVHFVEKK